MSEPVANLTPESVSRIYEVNKIRDYIHQKEVSEKLASFGIEEVDFYGSAMKGESNEYSDIDLYARHKGDGDYGKGYSRKDPIDKAEMVSQYKKKIQQLFQEAGIGKVVGANSIAERAKQQGLIVHLYIFGRNESWYETRPPFMSDPKDKGIEIWPK